MDNAHDPIAMKKRLVLSASSSEARNSAATLDGCFRGYFHGPRLNFSSAKGLMSKRVSADEGRAFFEEKSPDRGQKLRFLPVSFPNYISELASLYPYGEELSILCYS